ncbi:hypothetical protein RHMOL_Rhmol05G0013500 [Rhododendron molle]|uniref:Uncharacterized protein n=1 Tax=Rhododendron molle TaxID=49168 RepID=A0ACC0NJM8_RHOML|nr:hypothetical protein RHMOL_Rhmol05G0013500 [Rhododendron molle]
MGVAKCMSSPAPIARVANTPLPADSVVGTATRNTGMPKKWFEEAVEAGHVYSLVGVTRTKYERGHKYEAYKMMNSLVSDYSPAGWMYQERSLYCSGKEKMMDLDTATELDPTLPYPYKRRAVLMMEESNVDAAIQEINRKVGYRALNNFGSVCVDCEKLDLAADRYMNALNIKHTRAHQGLARVYHLKNQRKAAYDEMTKYIYKARSNASAYEK